MKKTSMEDSMRDRIRKRAESRRNMGGLDTLALPEGVELYKPEKGVEEFDIIPYKVTAENHPEVKAGELWYERTYLAHRNVGPEEKFLICPRTIGKRCPICEEYQKLKRDPDADEDIVAGLKAKERELFNVVTKDGDGSVMLMDISVFLFGKKLEAEILEGDESNASFAELKDGKTLKVRWEQKTMGKNKFVEAGRIDFVDRDDIDEAALDMAVDLDEAMKILSYEEIEKIFQAGEDDDNEGKTDEKEKQDEETPARRVIGRGKPAEKTDDDDEEEDELPGLEKKKAKSSEDDDNICIACDGSGKNTKGKTCLVCDGTGKDHEDDADNDGKKEPEDDDDKPDKPGERKPVRRAIKR